MILIDSNYGIITCHKKKKYPLLCLDTLEILEQEGNLIFALIIVYLSTNNSIIKHPYNEPVHTLQIFVPVAYTYDPWWPSAFDTPRSTNDLDPDVRAPVRSRPSWRRLMRPRVYRRPRPGQLGRRRRYLVRRDCLWDWKERDFVWIDAI